MAKTNAQKLFDREHQELWNEIAIQNRPHARTLGAYYHRRLNTIYQQLIPQGKRVLELGCGQGDLLAGLLPSRGVGIDFSSARILQAKAVYPQLEWVCGEVEDIVKIAGPFDYIILSDFLQDSWDIQELYSTLQLLSHHGTRLISNYYSQLWEYPLRLGQKINRTHPRLPQNWLTITDNTNLLELADWKPIRQWEEIIFPYSVPIVTAFLNHYLVKIWPFHGFALSHFVIAQTKKREEIKSKASITVVVPARNEAGNIDSILKRMPDFGAPLEIIFVEGNSQDSTFTTIEKSIAENPNLNCRLLKQKGKGKGDAVRLGFDAGVGDIFMILDADLTVSPELLTKFYDVLVLGQGEFVNGVRLVYPMEKQAMQFANLVGNKFFSLGFSWLMGQNIKDTLCGTKALWKTDYHRIAEGRNYFGDFDPFGDFDLLFGAARLNLKIVDMPVRYGERTYGSTNIQRWRHGWLLLRMLVVAAKRLKFI